MDGYEATRHIKATVRVRATAYRFRFADIVNASAQRPIPRRETA